MDSQKLLSGWNDFWFAPVSAISIAVYRIFFGVLATASGVSIGKDLLVWCGENGVLSLKTAESVAPHPHINLFLFLPQGDCWVIAFFVLFMTAAIMLTVGLFTRWSAIAVWLGILSFCNRNPAFTNGGDNIMEICAFFLIFSQAGEALSVDRFLEGRKHNQSLGVRRGAPWAQRLIQIQLVVIYFTAFCLKISGRTWVSGEAVYYSSRMDLFWRFHIPYVFEHLWTIRLLTWGTLAFEGLFPVLIWIKEFRYPFLFIGLLFHAGLEAAMDIPFFQWATVAMYVTFIDPEDLNLVIAWIRGRVIRYFGKATT